MIGVRIIRGREGAGRTAGQGRADQRLQFADHWSLHRSRNVQVLLHHPSRHESGRGSFESLKLMKLW